MIKIEVKGLLEIQASIKGLEKEMPTIMAKTLTFTAERVQAGIKKEMSSIFDRPTPTTLNSLMKTAATAAKLESSVWFKDPKWTLSKTSANQHWIIPHVEGGSRPNKGIEKLLYSTKLMPKGLQAFPGQGVRLDRYGNIPAGTVGKIISSLGASGEQGFLANQTARSRKRNKKYGSYFATLKGQGVNPLAAGVWERMGNGTVRPILIYGRPARYGKRFRFYDIAQKIVDKNLLRIFNERLASARRKHGL